MEWLYLVASSAVIPIFVVAACRKSKRTVTVKSKRVKRDPVIEQLVSDETRAQDATNASNERLKKTEMETEEQRKHIQNLFKNEVTHAQVEQDKEPKSNSSTKDKPPQSDDDRVRRSNYLDRSMELGKDHSIKSDKKKTSPPTIVRAEITQISPPKVDADGPASKKAKSVKGPPPQPHSAGDESLRTRSEQEKSKISVVEKAPGSD